MAEWIYISPHLDDAALSCGGMIRQPGAAGRPGQHLDGMCPGEPLPAAFRVCPKAA